MANDKINSLEFSQIEGGVCAPVGFVANGVHCGLRRNKKHPDLALIYCDVPCNTAAVYTQNKVKGAPIHVTKANIANGIAQAVIVNSGNANTCNPDGEEKAAKMCALAANALLIAPNDVVVASTGIIGDPLPIEPIEKAIPKLKAGLSAQGNEKAREAILTTDLTKKEIAISFMIDGVLCKIGGMAKGSGMIHPNMATMLCFMTSDISISHELVQKAISTVTIDTFNMVSVDGDTSTNDMAVILCSGKAGNPMITNESTEAYQKFEAALHLVMRYLSREIARDGEGATKLLECNVIGAVNTESARLIAKSVITSSLFKCAMFGKDPNWGRILCAVGYSGGEVDVEGVEVELSSVGGAFVVCKNGRGTGYDHEIATCVLAASEIHINIKLSDGDSTATAWGCDFTYDYVKINAAYHT